MTSASSIFATLARKPRADDSATVETILVCGCGATADMSIPHDADGWLVAPVDRCPKCIDKANALEGW